jgi:hypothetical protein
MKTSNAYIILDISKPLGIKDSFLQKTFRIGHSNYEKTQNVRKIIYHYYLQGLQEIKIAI